MYHSPLIQKVTNLFKSTNLNRAFRTCNTICNQLYDRSPQNKINSSRIHRLQCKTCNKSYVGQTGISVEIRHHEHIRYKKNIPISAYALHILNNRHKYGSPEHTMQLLKARRKGKVMNYWESFYMQVLQQQNLLINEQKTNEPNPLYALSQHNETRHTAQKTLGLSTYRASMTVQSTYRWVHHQINILYISAI